MDDTSFKMEESRTRLGQLEEDELRKILGDLLHDNINFSAVQRSYIANTVDRTLSDKVKIKPTSVSTTDDNMSASPPIEDGKDVDKELPQVSLCVVVEVARANLTISDIPFSSRTNRKMFGTSPKKTSP